MRRLAIALTTCLALALAFSAPAPAAKQGKKKVIGKTSYYVEQSPTSFLDPAFVKSKRVSHPKKGSLSAKVTGANEDPAFDNQIYVSGLIQCVKNGQRYALGKVYYQQQSPFVLRKIPFPHGVRKPKSCKLEVSAGFDPENPPIFGETGPYGLITIKLFWKRGK
jgi:hypothetical protein